MTTQEQRPFPAHIHVQKLKTGEMERLTQSPTVALLPQKAVTTARPKTDIKLPVDKYGRAYLVYSGDEATLALVASAVARYLDIQGCYPLQIELSESRYADFGVHVRRYWPDASATCLYILPGTPGTRYDVICRGEVRRH